MRTQQLSAFPNRQVPRSRSRVSVSPEMKEARLLRTERRRQSASKRPPPYATPVDKGNANLAPLLVWMALRGGSKDHHSPWDGRLQVIAALG